MAATYRILNISGGGGSDDRKVKVSSDDALPEFLEAKVLAASSKVTVVTDIPGGDETLQIDVDETNIDHNILLNYDVNQHRDLDDASTTTSSLWSSTKIQAELDTKINAATPMTDNKLVKSIGTSGVDVEATGIDVDDSDNVTGINNLTIEGDLTVNGTTTSLNTATLEVEDANVLLNNGGTEASADAQNAGLTIEMSDATDAFLGFDSTLTSKFEMGPIGDSFEVVTTNHRQTIIDKVFDVDNNDVTNIETDNFKAGVIQTDISGAVSDTNLASSQAVKTYVDDQIATKDDASEITYTPNDLADWDSGVDPGNVDGALDQLADRTTTAEGSLAAHLDGGVAKHTATQVTYSGTLTATVVDTALDELDSVKYEAADFNGDFDARLASKDTDDLSEGSGNLYFTDARAHIEAGDISSTNFTFVNNQVVVAPITGLAFNQSTVRSFTANVSINRGTDNLYEEYEVHGINRGATFEISIESVGDDSGVELSITAAGQLQYTSSNLTAGGVISFRAKTNTI
jgi:hypothetical protein